MSFNSSEKRDAFGRWTTTGGFPIASGISKKIDKNVNPSEDILQRIAKAKAQGKDSEGRFTVDSLDMHRGPDGHLTPERQKLHDEIIDSFLKEGNSKTGVAYNLGGAPANGKSTLVDSGFIGMPKNLVHVDPDKIKAKLPEYNAMIKNQDFDAAAFSHEESSVIGKKLIAKANEAKLDMVVDGIGDGGIDKIEAKVQAMKEAGFQTRADYVTLDTEKSLSLAKARAIKTGREVPEKYVRDMNREISNLVPELTKRNTFDELNLWDTNINGKPRLILSHKKGVTTIHDKELYDNFLNKAK